MRKIISLICLLLPIAVYAEELRLRDNAPDNYLVQKGDTLWDISAKFFKDPWKWPQIWGYNKDTIKDPHWIYPGNTVYLDRETRTLKVAEGGVPASSNADSGAGSGASASADTGATQDGNGGNEVPDFESTTSSIAGAVKLRPRAREMSGATTAIPAISLRDIGPFLSRPLVFDDDEMDNAPELVAGYDHRQLLGTNDVVYATHMSEDEGVLWQIYRETKTFRDPETGEYLGTEVAYLGDAAVQKFGEVTTLNITHSVLEIHKGDRFAQARRGFNTNFVPRAPEKEIVARIISIYGGVVQAGQNNVVTLNKGSRDGLENGHVLALYQRGEELKNGNIFKRNIVLPDVRTGLVFVFRVFDKVSYALIMESRRPVEVGDRASNPE